MNWKGPAIELDKSRSILQRGAVERYLTDGALVDDKISEKPRLPPSVRHKKFGPSLTAAEGFILGRLAKMFTIAGPVITFGLTASVVYGLILCLLQ